MSLFDVTVDAREILEDYKNGLGRYRTGSVVMQAVQSVLDQLRAVQVMESSPFPIQSFVNEKEGAFHLKKTMTKGEHAAWLALVDKAMAEGRTAVE